MRVSVARRDQVWIQDDAGNILRGWLPTTGHSNLSPGDSIRVYCDGPDDLAGWATQDPGVAVNQRGFIQRSEPRDLACQGPCKIVWIAPAPDAVVAGDKGCLECGGRLVAL